MTILPTAVLDFVIQSFLTTKKLIIEKTTKATSKMIRIIV